MTERLNFEKPRVLKVDIAGLEVANGLDEASAAQLIKKSRQLAILRSVPKDAKGRFNNLESLDEWLNQGREVYTLSNNGDLAGVIWYGRKEYPYTVPPGLIPPEDTFAIRMYNRYRGKHLAGPFMQTTLIDYSETLNIRGKLEDNRGIWLSTSPSNVVAQQLYSDFGYNMVGFVNGEAIMVLPPSKIMAYRALSSVG